jgi:transposase InsO family protein
MTQSGDPLENAIAERVNGILKGEWLNDLRLKDLDDCKNELTRIIAFYNNKRPHISIDMQTPSLVHMSTRKYKSRWKKHSKESQVVEKKDLLCKTQGEAVIV